MNYQYTIDDVLAGLKEKGKELSRPTLITLMRNNGLVRERLAIKELNGWEKDGAEGKIWKLTYEGYSRLIDLGLTTRKRRTKEEIEQSMEYVNTSVEIKKSVKDDFDVYLQSSGKSQKNVINELLVDFLKEKKQIIDQIKELQKRL